MKRNKNSLKRKSQKREGHLFPSLASSRRHVACWSAMAVVTGGEHSPVSLGLPLKSHCALGCLLWANPHVDLAPGCRLSLVQRDPNAPPSL